MGFYEGAGLTNYKLSILTIPKPPKPPKPPQGKLAKSSHILGCNCLHHPDSSVDSSSSADSDLRFGLYLEVQALQLFDGLLLSLLFNHFNLQPSFSS